jgi:hypothetical protein
MSVMQEYVILRRFGWPSGQDLQEAAERSRKVVVRADPNRSAT